MATCLDLLASLSGDLGQLARDIKELMASLDLIFFAHGVVLPTIVLVGVLLNALSFATLVRHQFQSSPYSLLQGLCLCDICILTFAIYSDTEPAIRAKGQMEKFKSQFLPSCDALLSLNHRHGLRNASLSDTSSNASWSQEGFSGNGQRANGSGEVDRNGEGQGRKVVSINLTTSDTVEETNRMLIRILMRELEREASQAKSLEATDARESTTRPATEAGTRSGNEKENLPGLIGNLPIDVVATFCPSTSSLLSSSTSVTSSSTSFLLSSSPSVTSSSTFSLLCSSSPVTPSPSFSLSSVSPSVTSSPSISLPPSSPSMMPSPSISHPSSSSPVTSQTPFPEGVVINERPALQATERWLAYNLLTFNLGLTMTLAAERCVAIAFPFRESSWLSVKRSRLSVILLLGLTLVLHSPQYIKEMVLAHNAPETLQDDFQGRMLQSFRRHYETFIVHFTSVCLVLLLALNFTLICMLRRYKVKVVSNRQPGNQGNVDVNITVSIVAIVFLQLPHNIAMNILATMSLEGFTSNVTSFTQAVVIIRLLYVSSSAVHCLTYCFMSKRFRVHFKKTFCAPFSRACACLRNTNKDFIRKSALQPRQRRRWTSCCPRHNKRLGSDVTTTSTRPSVGSTPMCQTSVTSSDKSYASSKVTSADTCTR